MSITPVEMEDRVDRLFAVLDVESEHLRNCLSRLGELRCLVIKRDEAALSKLLEDIHTEAEDYAGNESKRLALRRELAGLDVLKGNVKLLPLRFAAVYRGSDEDVSRLGVDAPQARSALDHGTR